MLEEAQSYYASASDTTREITTPFTIAKLVGEQSNLSATATEWYPDSPQLSDNFEPGSDSFEASGDQPECLSPDHLGFVPYDYPILSVEGKVDSDIWKYHNKHINSAINIKSIIREEAISSDNPSRIGIQAATWNINGGLHKHRQKFTSICWLFSALQMDVLVLTDTRLTESE